MQSFYGGRHGAAFVIVKHFDGIDIPQPKSAGDGIEPTYTADEYAFENNSIIITDKPSGDKKAYVQIGEGNLYLIKRTANNFAEEGYRWETYKNDGGNLPENRVFKGEGNADISGSLTFPRKLAEGMVQCFSQGAASSSEVNYAEYVIIDTIVNMHEGNNPDNGKVFRRGMNITGEYAGAEYIGQVVGPQGQSPEINIDDYKEIANADKYPTFKLGSYDMTNEGIIPGVHKDEEGKIVYETDIKYAWTTIRDAFGNVQGCLMGFRFPTLMQEYHAESISPYTEDIWVREYEPTSENDNPPVIGYQNLILPDKDFYDEATGQWKYPFYQKWQLRIPEGIHGVDARDFRVIPSKTFPIGYKISETETFKGIQLYRDSSLSESSKDLFLDDYEGSLNLIIDSEVIKDDKGNLVSMSLQYPQEEGQDGYTYYVDIKDCYMYVLQYKEIYYDSIEQGEQGIANWRTVGEYNTIDKLYLSSEGILTVFYNGKKDFQDLKEPIRWIEQDGVTVADDGTIRVTYNTVDEAGNKQYQEMPKALDWVTEIKLGQDGKLEIQYNNDTVKIGQTEDGEPILGDKYETVLSWIDKVDVEDDGTVNFYFNSNHETPVFKEEKKLKAVKDIKIDTGDIEGTGTQKIQVQYNTGEEYLPIGEPINYVMETCISTPNLKYPNAPYSHLLVYYSDPELRKKYKDRWVQYPSGKLFDDEGNPRVWNEWVDLGDTKGQAGGIHVIKEVNSMDDLKDAGGNAIPPEQLKVGDEVASYAAGWSVTLKGSDDTPDQILFYDYDTKNWYSVGSLDASAIKPEYVIVKSKPTADGTPAVGDADLLRANGFWLAEEEAYSAM